MRGSMMGYRPVKMTRDGRTKKAKISVGFTDEQIEEIDAYARARHIRFCSAVRELVDVGITSSNEKQ